jgi:methionine aminopeptidase
MSEVVGSEFNLEVFMNARKLARKISLLFASHMEVGTTYNEAFLILEDLIDKHGAQKRWHPTKLRFGSDTAKAFREKSDTGKALQKDDIYFLDIGPVFDGHEADFGQTFTIGQNPEFAAIQRASKVVFDKVHEKWRSESLTGIQLYDYAKKCAKDLGYELNDKMAGHRVSEFPHAIHYKKSLKDYESKPSENIWILEILLKHPTKEFGAFFEDIFLR